MNFKRFLAAMIGGVSTVFLLSVCIFTATEYEPGISNGNDDNESNINNYITYFNLDKEARSYNNRNFGVTRGKFVSRNEMVEHNEDNMFAGWNTDHYIVNDQLLLRSRIHLALVPNGYDSSYIISNFFRNFDMIRTTGHDCSKTKRHTLFVGEYQPTKSHSKLTNYFADYAVVGNETWILSQAKTLLNHHMKNTHRLFMIIKTSYPQIDRDISYWRQGRISGQDVIDLLEANYLLVLGGTFANVPTQIQLSTRAQLTELPEDLRSNPDIPADDNDDPVPPTVPSYPELPGDELPGDNNNDNDNGYDEEDDYDYTYPTRLNWWQQFMVWWRRQLFRD